ncbi:MAG TPA: hypothetical protein PLP33_24780 [Leptospiraceae bacterium]|nr:hypothetical protein [Leptospiraceae bacterium]
MEFNDLLDFINDMEDQGIIEILDEDQLIVSLELFVEELKVDFDGIFF